MKGKRRLLVGLVFGIMMGWAWGFLRLPYLEKNHSFLLGFITALVCVSLLIVLLTTWNRHFLPGLVEKKTVAGNSPGARTHTFFWIMLAGVLVLGSVVGGLTVYRRNASFQLQIQNQAKQLQEMAALVASVRKSNLEPLLRSLLNDVGEELKRNPGRTLRDATIARIAALSFAFQSYKYIEADSLSKQACSPERGQLLQALLLMNIDSRSFARIKENTLFAGADLRGADLKGLDLSGIDLRDANLKGADLSGASLHGADLREVNLWGANLNRAKLSNADLKRADLRWALLNEANLSRANLNGATLTNAQLRKADLNDASLQWAQAAGALFNEAILTSVDFVGANLTKGNLSQANLTGADLRKINLSEAELAGARLNGAIVDKNWPEKLKEWQPAAVKELQQSYSIVNDKTDQFKNQLYRLKKNG